MESFVELVEVKREWGRKKPILRHELWSWAERGRVESHTAESHVPEKSCELSIGIEVAQGVN